MSFRLEQKILFKHCDPAGIVFYPRYFEMINDTVECFFDQNLNFPFHELHRQFGVPTVAIQTKFLAPSRHGETLDIELSPTRIGGSSLDLDIRAHCDGEARFKTSLTLVFINAAGQPIRWEDDLRQVVNQQIQ